MLHIKSYIVGINLQIDTMKLKNGYDLILLA